MCVCGGGRGGIRNGLLPAKAQKIHIFWHNHSFHTQTWHADIAYAIQARCLRVGHIHCRAYNCKYTHY